MRTVTVWLTSFAILALATAGCGSTSTSDTKSAPAASAAPAITDQQVSDAYIYLLSRLLVLRQQQADFQEGFKWNTLIHRKLGEVQWPNPNLDVAYSEAWVAVDEGAWNEPHSVARVWNQLEAVR